MNQIEIGIYKITSPSGKIYIGQSWNIYKRKIQYNSVKCSGQVHLFRSLQKYGFINHKFEIIHQFIENTIIQEELDFYEQHYMDYYRLNGCELMNIREGGSKGKQSEETKKKLSLASKKNGSGFKKGHKHSKETLEKLSLSHKGKLSPRKGMKCSPKSVEKMIMNRTGKCVGQDHWRTKDLLNIQTGEIYHSISEAAKKLNVKRTTLNAQLSGQTKINKLGVIYALITIEWGTKIISVLKTDLTLISGTLYELDTEQFRLDLKDLEDSEEGMPFLDTHKHNTEVTVAGVTFARTIEIINGYSITFEDGQYSVRLVGSNNNFFDVNAGILNQNQVQVIPGNSAGLIVSGSGVTPEDITAIADTVWKEVLEGTIKAEEILRLLLSVAVGKSSITDLGEGLATVKFRDTEDTKDRVTADMTDSERTAVTIDGA